jgi:hypothetical protein
MRGPSVDGTWLWDRRLLRLHALDSTSMPDVGTAFVVRPLVSVAPEFPESLGPLVACTPASSGVAAALQACSSQAGPPGRHATGLIEIVVQWR